MPSIKELVESGADVPQWLLDAKVENEDIELSYKTVVWHSGTWKSGIWEGGIWEKGVWHYGIWEGGTWLSGSWKGGLWKSGIWERGVWLNGQWYTGRWVKGVWHSGVWSDGTWLDGTWISGTWISGSWSGGLWKSGSSRLRSKYQPVITNMGAIRIGCKTKTPEEWSEWLASDKEYETPRGTPEFKLIEAHIRAAITYLEVLNGTKQASSVFSLQGIWKAIKRKLNK